MMEVLKKQVADEILKLISHSLSKSSAEIASLLERPKSFDHGHLALPIFSFAKEKKTAPPQLASQWATELQNKIPFLTRVEAISGFINFTFAPEHLQSTLFQSMKSEKSLGSSRIGEGKTVIVDFSSPNIAKPMHVGHLRATVIGQAIKNLADTQGYKTIGVNHIGDWGSQFGKLAWALQTWGGEYDFSQNPMDQLLQIYIRFHQEAEKNPELEKKGAETFKRLENGDPEIEKIWKQVIRDSFRDYDRLYQLLGTRHDVVLGESFYNDKLEDVVHRLEQCKLLQESEGAQVVFFDEKENMPPCLIKKSDGASIYATRDLAAALYRHEVQKGDLLLYVVGQDQSLHFRQVFKVLEMMGFDWARNCHHIAFGLYKFKEGKMSTRQGRVVLFEDILQKSIEMVEKVIAEKNPDLENKSEVARQVAVGAIVFNDLLNDRVKNVDFDWDRVLNFEGDSGPYVQYTNVRCRSLLRKAQFTLESWDHIPPLHSPEEQKLIFTLLQFQDVLALSFRNFKPNILAQYLLELCLSFSHFYHKHRILQEEPQVQKARLSLVWATEKILSRGLEVLNIPAPSSM